MGVAVSAASPDQPRLVAAILSVIETCRRLKIPVRDYLLDVLPRLGEWPANRVAELTPAAWAASRSAA